MSVEREDGSTNDLTEAHPVTEQDRTDLYMQIQQMSVQERIKLARLGNKEVRGLLIREPIRSVQVAVLNNARITDSESERIASSRTVHDEVIRLILNNRDWLRNYAIKLALINNPRTPLKASLRLLSHLRERDLKNLISSKNVSNTLIMAAKKLLSSRQK